MLRDYIDKHENEVRLLETLVQLLWEAGLEYDVSEAFEQPRKVAGVADLSVPVLSRLGKIAQQLYLPADGRIAPPLPPGDLPQLERLGPLRVFRGGSWGGPAQFCRAAARFSIHPNYKNDYVGFCVIMIAE